MEIPGNFASESPSNPGNFCLKALAILSSADGNVESTDFSVLFNKLAKITKQYKKRQNVDFPGVKCTKINDLLSAQYSASNFL